jgi:hypothetical protein
LFYALHSPPFSIFVDSGYVVDVDDPRFRLWQEPSLNISSDLRSRTGRIHRDARARRIDISESVRIDISESVVDRHFKSLFFTAETKRIAPPSID